MFEDRNRLPDTSVNTSASTSKGARGLKGERTRWSEKSMKYRDMTVYMVNLFGELEIWNKYCDYYDGLPADRVIVSEEKIAEYLDTLSKLSVTEQGSFYML